MAGGLAALLDDISVIARNAAAQADDVAAAAGKTSSRAAAVVVDDTAVTPGYLKGASPARELPMIWRITKGSLVNKIVIILPIALLLSWIAPWALTPILMCGGTYLAFEGAEKIWEYLLGKGHGAASHHDEGGRSEDDVVKAAIRTDLILSAEIMVISLNEVADEPLWMRAAVLIVVALLVTGGVYGVVALLVKLDDVGAHLDRESDGALAALGRGMVHAMPKIMTVLSVVGTFAMLWVGGHILVVGVAEFGWHAPHELAVHLAGLTDIGALSWLIDTACSAVAGFIVGSAVAGIVWGIQRARGRGHSPGAEAHAHA